MKHYHYFFVSLRILVVLQIVLVLSGKVTTHPHVKLLIDTLLKLGIGAFLVLFFMFNEIPDLDPWDSFIIQFSGVVLMLSIDFSSILDIINIYSPMLSQRLDFLKAIQRK